MVNEIFNRENKDLESFELEKKIHNKLFLEQLQSHNVLSILELILREIVYFKIEKNHMLKYMESRFEQLGKIEKTLQTIKTD